MAKIFFGSLLIAGVLITAFAAANPNLHRWMHFGQDSTHANTCAVTIFAQGQMDSVAVETPLASITWLVQGQSLIAISAYAPAIQSLPAGRAPPVSSANS